ncbi:unnamed protein product, partial [Timema podura]|nr:unnamed protein product [Timema podura]
HFLKGLNPFLSTLEFAEQEGVEVFLPGEPEDLLDRGEVHIVPYITGINNMEGKISVLDVLEDESLWRNKEETFERYVPADLGLPVGSVHSVQLAKRIKHFYFGDQPLSKKSMAGLINV